MHWVYGSLNVDLVVQMDRFPLSGETLIGTSFSTFLGGKGGNQAMALARLGGSPRVVAHVGDDAFGRRYRNALADAGADVSRVDEVENVATGTALIEVESSGQNRIVIVPGANGTVTVEHVEEELSGIAAGDILLLQLEIPHDTVRRAASFAKRSGAFAILDPAPAAPLPHDLYPDLEWITPNETEAAAITGIETSDEEGIKTAAIELVRRGTRKVAIKAGARGAVYYSADRARPVLVPGFDVEVVDTTAAGDSFNAGLAWALGDGRPDEDAIRIANAVAAIAVTGLGAQTAMPSAADLQRFLQSQGGLS